MMRREGSEALFVFNKYEYLNKTFATDRLALGANELLADAFGTSRFGPYLSLGVESIRASYAIL